MSVRSVLTSPTYSSTATLSHEKEKLEKKRKLSGLLKKKGRGR